MVNWLEVVTGVMLLLEAWQMHHPGNIFQPAICYAVIALATIVTAVLHSRVPHLRVLRIESEGFSIRTSPFRKISVQWGDADKISYEGNTLHASLKGGVEKRISLRRVENKEEVFKELRSVAAKRGISLNGGS
jgi:hypothetical protein